MNSMQKNLPFVFGVNGPAGSGKTYLTESVLPELFPGIVIMRPSDMLYSLMRANKEPGTDVSYQEYKQLPDARWNLIKHATRQRAADVYVYSRMITESLRYNKAEIVLIDNIGFPDEVDWFAKYSNTFVLLRIETPFKMESLKVKGNFHQGQMQWPNDSRFSCVADTMLTAHDSIQMALLLDWIFGLNFDSSSAGNYNDVRKLWTEFCTRRAGSSRN